MKKIIILSLLILSAVQFKLSAQVEKSIQINGGLMSATNSDKGALGTIQFNYTIKNSFSLYSYSGILYWNNNIVNYYAGEGTYNNLRNTFSEDSHRMIPFYLGGKYFFNNSSVFRPFVNVEFGLAYLTFNSYDLQQVTNPDGTVSVLHDKVAEQKETLFGTGIGLGVIHDLGKSLQLLLEFKINTVKNSNYDWFSSGGTLRTFQFGFGYKI